MPPMLRPHWFALALAVAAMIVAAPADARPKKAPKPAAPKRYHFALIEVKAGPDVKLDQAPDLPAAIKAEAEKQMAAHPQLLVALADAPGEDAGFPAWTKYLAKQKLAGAYRVNIEITGYTEELEDKDPGDKIDLRLVLRLDIKMFGEVIPLRTMAFTGEGGSTVKADVGRKLRPKDRDFNLAGAIELAVKDALAASLHKLETAPPPKK